MLPLHGTQLWSPEKNENKKNDIFQVIFISGKKTVREVSQTTKENWQPRSLFRLPVHGGAWKQSDSGMHTADGPTKGAKTLQ